MGASYRAKFGEALEVGLLLQPAYLPEAEVALPLTEVACVALKHLTSLVAKPRPAALKTWAANRRNLGKRQAEATPFSGADGMPLEGLEPSSASMADKPAQTHDHNEDDRAHEIDKTERVANSGSSALELLGYFEPGDTSVCFPTMPQQTKWHNGSAEAEIGGDNTRKIEFTSNQTNEGKSPFRKVSSPRPHYIEVDMRDRKRSFPKWHAFLHHLTTCLHHLHQHHTVAARRLIHCKWIWHHVAGGHCIQYGASR